MTASTVLFIAAAGMAVAFGGSPAGARPGAHVVVEERHAWDEAWLAAKTTVALFRAGQVTGEQVGEIVVVAEGDRVVLRGVVDRVEASQAAAATAHRVPGVWSVGNELRVVPATAPSPRPVAELASAVAEALRRAPALQGAAIRLQTDAVMVTLWGSVHTIGDWALASRLARSVAGVHAVRNLLAIESLDPVVDGRGTLGEESALGEGTTP